MKESRVSRSEGSPGGRWSRASRGKGAVYAEKELPQPHPPEAFGFLNVKPEPCIDET